MPTTDTFIIPPMQPEEEPKKDKKQKKEQGKSGGHKTFIFIGLILLILTLPVAIYYISQQQQLADTRSKAEWKPPTSNQCSAGESRCQTNADGTNTGYICKCVSSNGYLAWGCGSQSSSCPTGTSNQSGSTVGTRTTPDGTAGGCGYIQKPPNSGNQSCNEQTCGMNCGKYTYDCGQLCFDGSCGGTGCASGGGVGLTTESTTESTTNPTATPEPTATPTTAPTSAPNSSQCDASCSTDSNCISGLSCASVDGINRCRNANCPAEATCSCPSAESTPEPTTPSTNDTTTYTDTTTGDAMPVSGVGPGIIGSLTVVGSVFLLLIGLAL